MNKVERVTAVLNGRPPDRPPVGFWHHFSPTQREGGEAVKAHLVHFESYDLDFLKVMYDLGYPSDGVVTDVGDLRKLTVRRGDDGVFGKHLSTIREIATRLGGDALIASTIFNAWATLRRLMLTDAYRPGAGPSPASDERSRRILEVAVNHPAVVRDALAVIGETLANFARCCVDAGADGVFLSVRDDWLGSDDAARSRYDEIVRPTDLAILGGASDGRFNLLHVCGRAMDFSAFADYPVHAVNWADRTAGPAMRDVAQSIRPAPCGGVNQIETLRNGSESECAAEVHDAVAQAQERPVIIAPGCTYDPIAVPPDNLRAVRRAVCDA